MAAKSLTCPTVARLLLEYDARTGKLTWRARAQCWFRSARRRNIWNAKYAGKEAFTAEKRGYRYGLLLGKFVSAHRVAWAITHGHWPKDMIDHKSGDRGDNRISNLREATRSQNARNRVSRKNAASKYLGVDLCHTGKWRAQIKLNTGEQKYIGQFDTEEDAARAYDAVAVVEHGEFARPNFPQESQP